ncbi:M20/M25/M40 family metallo-hydrolase, partial [Candidatus Falkowbacteria bacterium]|nr:M20/M25/M40 family metallo-hydrolase [Candidatus Falkowbacteria bacterium]
MIGWILLALVLAALLVMLVRAMRFRPRSTPPAPPVAEAVDAEAAARCLSALVQCRTISHADPAQNDEAEFTRLRALLPELFPQVHAACQVETIGDRGILYRWKGRGDGAPLILTAHYDVVPVDADQWTFPPFSGDIAEGVIHGRGTLDTKCTLSAILTAAETLLAQGYAPERDLYFCFAGDEEVLGHGAREMAAELDKRGVRPLMVLDEGGAIVENVFPGVAKPCALIGAAEKGSVNYRLRSQSRGGHSSA